MNDSNQNLNLSKLNQKTVSYRLKRYDKKVYSKKRKN